MALAAGGLVMVTVAAGTRFRTAQP
jgi:hypothetical protein